MTIDSKELFSMATEVDPITYETFRRLVDQGITEVIERESMYDFEVAEVVLDSLYRLSQKHPEHNDRYAGELAMASSVE